MHAALSRAGQRPLSDQASIGIPFSQHLDKGLQQYLDIKPEAPIVDVPKIKLHPFGDVLDRWRGSPRAIALSPPGHARLDVMAKGVIADEPFEVIVARQCVGTRADQRHIPFLDVQ